MAFKTAAEMFGDGGGFGPAVPYSITNPPSTSAGNRGIQFGEQLTAAIANRTHYALALNDEDLNTRLAAFEAGGLDAAYDNGTIGPAGGGREITKDGGAVETTSALLTQYADDSANAHFRANALLDAVAGGGFDFRGGSFNAYGLLSRQSDGIGGAYTTLAASAAATLNPGGAGGDVIRYGAGTVSTAGNTDLGLNGLDLIEITGAGAGVNGLYVIFDLGPVPGTDVRVRRLDGTAPAFGVGVPVTVRLFHADLMSSATGRALPSGGFAGTVVGGRLNYASALAILGNDYDNIIGTGCHAIHFVTRDRTGGQQSLAWFTSSGRLKSSVNSDLYASADARALEWAEAGIPIVHVDKGEGGASGYHEIGMLVREQTGASSSWAGLETRGTILETTVFGINASIPGTFAAPMGRIILPDSDGAPAAPAGQLKTLWALFVQPGVTLVRILTGSGSGRYYLLSAVNLTAAGAVPDEIVLTHIDGSALDVGELPTVGALTFQFVQRQVVGGKLPPITVETAPVGFTGVPTDLTPSTVVAPPTETTGDPNGPAAMGVRGSIFGFRSYDVNTVVLPATVHADVPWVIDGSGNVYTKGEIISDDLVQGETLRVNNNYYVSCEQTDRLIHLDMTLGQPEMTAAGAAQWRYDRTNQYWELIDLDGNPDAAIYFPIQFSGRLMETRLQVYENTLLQYVYSSLYIITPDWTTPSNPLGFTVANEDTYLGGSGSFGLSTINHGLGSGTLMTPGTASYSIRVRATQVGARVRAIRCNVRFLLVGPGGMGG